MRTTVSTKGQIIIPAEIRREDEIESGQEFEIERLDRGEYLLKRATGPRNRGLVKLLLSCPVKDWFQPLERTESTDDIRLPKLFESLVKTIECLPCDCFTEGLLQPWERRCHQLCRSWPTPSEFRT